jgi:hypothetical protein
MELAETKKRDMKYIEIYEEMKNNKPNRLVIDWPMWLQVVCLVRFCFICPLWYMTRTWLHFSIVLRSWEAPLRLCSRRYWGAILHRSVLILCCEYREVFPCIVYSIVV